MPTGPRHYLLAAKLDAHGQRLLDMVYEHLLTTRAWPVSRAFAPVVFKALHLDLGMAMGRLHGFVQEEHERPLQSQEIGRVVLTFAGLARVPAAEQDVSTCLRVLKFLGQQAIDHSANRDTVTLGEVIDALGLGEEEAVRLAAFIWADGMAWRTTRVAVGLDRDLAFRLSPQQMYLADITTADDALTALSPSLPELVEWPNRESPIGWLRDTIAHLDWAKRDEVAHHLRAAEQHHQERRWDDSAVQLRKAFEQLVGDLSLAISTARGEGIAARQSKPKFEEHLDYVKACGLLGDGERKILSANYSWLSEKGAHPGIPDEIDGETKWVVATELLRLLVARAISMPGAAKP